ncbi:uncharacterized protein LOC111815170 [Octodon degus]|uniref:Uncharacterized protein LOC111815170 n=1 Tax=Octodon degus TaxID=10160 RepID=A0A6P6DZ32_OCTDE|nr:uncharacterized protein LOC111815170 [Octodon degus]
MSVRRGQALQDPAVLRDEGGHGGDWEAEKQVDLEWFDTEAFFEILLQQSLTVTTQLSQNKEEVAEAASRAAEEEARRRAQLAAEYTASLSHQLQVLHQDLQARQEQWATFSSALTEAKRLLKAQMGSRPRMSSSDGQSHQGVVPQMDAVLDHLAQTLLQEGHRLKAWGFLGTGTGAELLRPALADSQAGADDIRMNPVTRLLVPGPKCAMLPASGHAGPIPPGYFIHPNTGRVLPEAGHLGYDLLSATLVPTTDSNPGSIRTSEATILPYVPYPTCSDTGSLPATDLPILQPQRTSQLGALMTDPVTGIEVPVLAVTLHPQTRQWLTLGGTYCNPLTKTLAPLELGGPMEDPGTGGISLILGVGFDGDTGLLAALGATLHSPPYLAWLLIPFFESPHYVPNCQVRALGGLRDAAGNLVLPGDTFVEPLSRKTVRLQGASQQKDRTLPCAGGPQALLDANVLEAQRRVVTVLQQWQEHPGWRAQGPLDAAIKDVRQALALSLHHILQQARRLARQLEAARGIEASGGRVGMVCYPGTEVWIPALYGMEIPDPEGSGLMVPILGMQKDGTSGYAMPLAGSMEDADGKGLVPISIGSRAIDPWTGAHGPVIGAQMDPFGNVVVPVVQVLEALPRGTRDPGLWDLLEHELKARQQYWYHREQEEERLVEHLGHLSRDLHTLGNSARLQLKAAKEACAALEACYLQETQRRSRTLSMLSSTERGPLSQADKKEWEEEAQVVLGMKKVLQSLEQAAEKLRQASLRLQGQEEEMWLQQAM